MALQGMGLVDWPFAILPLYSAVMVNMPAGVQPRQIGVVVVNSSLFNPTPSLSATIMNHFKMPHTTLNYNLGGMGCSGELSGTAKQDS